MKNAILIEGVTPTELMDQLRLIIKEEFSVLNKELDEASVPADTSEAEELLTRNETAKLLKISLSTLWHWSKDGRLKAYGLGNRVYYKKSEILEKIIQIN